MEDRHTLKERELRVLAEEYRKDKALFAQSTNYDDASRLRRLGIYLPNRELFPLGYLKLWPQDFIVEEVAENGSVSTIAYENVLEPGADIPETGPTIYATLVKCGLSTIEAGEDLCKQLSCGREQIQWTGIKDKDALTAQEISFRGVSLEQLKKVSSKYFFLKNVRYGKGVISKGQLRGNRFTILARTGHSLDLPGRMDTFMKQVAQVQQKGFYNFYYIQRFGVPRLNNFEIAMKILRGEYEAAVRQYLCEPCSGENQYFQKLRGAIGEAFGNWEKVQSLIRNFPLTMSQENLIVDSLLAKPNDFRAALGTIHEQITLWVYALSSWLFNMRLSAYILAGTRPPPKLPLFLSYDRADWLPYEEWLRAERIFPPQFQNIKMFPAIQPRHREVSTLERAEIGGAELTEQGIVFRFTLSKGQYATTFLSHLFTLVSGKVPEDISSQKIDTKATLGEESLSPSLEYFKDAIRPKTENPLEDFGEEAGE